MELRSTVGLRAPGKSVGGLAGVGNVERLSGKVGWWGPEHPPADAGTSLGRRRSTRLASPRTDMHQIRPCRPRPRSGTDTQFASLYGYGREHPD